MKRQKRSGIIIGVLVTVLFMAPLIVLAAIYLSGSRENVFRPASADIRIKEGSSTGEHFQNSYSWSEDSGAASYSAEKTAAVSDVRKMNDEYLRVRFVPQWFDAQGFLTGAQAGVSDYSKVRLNDERTALLFQDSGDPAQTLLTLELAENWEQDWSYEADCFYYNGLIRADSTTPDLLRRVVIPKTVYDSSGELIFRLDVLADAVQQYGGASSRREWAQP